MRTVLIWGILSRLFLCKIVKFRRKLLHSLKVVREYNYFSPCVKPSNKWIKDCERRESYDKNAN